MTAVAILGILVIFMIGRSEHASEAAKVAEATLEIGELQSEIDSYAMSTGSWPADLSEIGRGGAVDPWGRPYEYLRFGTKIPSSARKDGFLVPLNTTYDLYSKGRDGLTTAPLTDHTSKDDVLRANDGAYIGLGSLY